MATAFMWDGGAGGVGTLTIDEAEAVVTSGDDFQLGEGQGTLDFSAGLLCAGFTVIGKFGTGLWNQSGGMFDQDLVIWKSVTVVCPTPAPPLVWREAP